MTLLYLTIILLQGRKTDFMEPKAFAKEKSGDVDV